MNGILISRSNSNPEGDREQRSADVPSASQRKSLGRGRPFSASNPVHPVNLVHIFPSPAFSLIEVVLALGVVSFAIVGIMGMFPVAMQLARESQQETRAAHIARQIFSDIQASPTSNVLLAVGTNLTSPAGFITPNPSLAASWTNTISYDQAGHPLGAGTIPEAIFIAAVANSPNTPSAGLARIQVDVMAPASAPPANRTTNTFVTLLRQE